MKFSVCLQQLFYAILQKDAARVGVQAKFHSNIIMLLVDGNILSSGVPTMIPLILVSGSRRRGIGPNDVSSGTSSSSLNL